MAAIIQAPAFASWRTAFVAEHVAVFEYGEENKLEYTPIHEAYCAAIEARLEAALPAGVTMDAFGAALQPFLAANPSSEESGEAIKLLLESSDFGRPLPGDDALREEPERADADRRGPAAHARRGGERAPDRRDDRHVRFASVRRWLRRRVRARTTVPRRAKGRADDRCAAARRRPRHRRRTAG
jgi:hypothetical protein